MLLVLAAPSKRDSYYKNHFNDIIDFHVSYAEAIMEGGDNVVIFADKTAMPYLKSRLPNENLLLIDEQLDPWIRDVSPVYPGKNIQFQYSGGLKRKEAEFLQRNFNKVISKYNVAPSAKVDFLNDGGNFIYNRELGIVLTTDKFLKLNKTIRSEAKPILRDIFDAKQVAILPADDEKLGHVDGMCAFVSDTLVVVNYEDDPDFRDSVLKKLDHLEEVDIKEIDCPVSNKKASGGFASAYGIYVNCVQTENAIYVPIFNDPQDEDALELFRKILSRDDDDDDRVKRLIPVDASNVCHLGGSLRCLSWEVEGEDAYRLIQAAKLSSIGC